MVFHDACVQKLILTHPYDMNLDNFWGKGKSYASFFTWKENSVKHQNFSKFYDHDCTLTCCIVSIHYFLDFMVRKFYCHFHLFILIQTKKNHQLIWEKYEFARVLAATGDVLQKDVFLKISQKSQENAQSYRPKASNFIKKRFQRRCFYVNFTKFLRISLLPAGRLVLQNGQPVFEIFEKLL